MPKGEFSTPGPYRRDGDVVRLRGCVFAQALLSERMDEAERDELVGLLNKGTHFERMLEALETIRDAAGESIPDDTLALAPDDTARDMMHIGYGVAFMSIQRHVLDTIAAAEGKPDG